LCPTTNHTYSVSSWFKRSNCISTKTFVSYRNVVKRFQRYYYVSSARHRFPTTFRRNRLTTGRRNNNDEKRSTPFSGTFARLDGEVGGIITHNIITRNVYGPSTRNVRNRRRSEVERARVWVRLYNARIVCVCLIETICVIDTTTTTTLITVIKSVDDDTRGEDRCRRRRGAEVSVRTLRNSRAYTYARLTAANSRSYILYTAGRCTR